MNFELRGDVDTGEVCHPIVVRRSPYPRDRPKYPVWLERVVKEIEEERGGTGEKKTGLSEKEKNEVIEKKERKIMESFVRIRNGTGVDVEVNGKSTLHQLVPSVEQGMFRLLPTSSVLFANLSGVSSRRQLLLS